MQILESKENLSNEEIDELHTIRNTLTSLSGVEKDLEDKVKSASSKYDKIINRIKEEGMCMVCYEEKSNNFITTGCCNSIYCSKCISCLKKDLFVHFVELI